MKAEPKRPKKPARTPKAPLHPRARRGEAPFVAPGSIVADGAIVGDDAVIGVFSLVAKGAVVGAATRIQGHTSVWDGVALGEGVFVGPAVAFTNVKRPRVAFTRAPEPFDRTIVGDGATLGARAVLVAPVKVGAYAFVAAGAVVTNDVPPHALVVGVPARVRGWVCVCGDVLVRGGRRPSRAACARCGCALERGSHGGLARVTP